MRNTQPNGGPSLLDVRIDAKVYTGANGERVEAVRGVRLRLEGERMTALLGPSGCGKTTILRIISGLDTAFEGALHWHAPPRIGFVFQEPNLLPWRTVRQNIELTKAADFGPADTDRLTEQFGLSLLMNRFPSELSLGLARRVSLARALASRPSVLLLDEPLASLDEGTAGQLRGLLRDIQEREAVCSILVTHNLREAIELADRLILLTPRPARIIADLSIDLPRAERGPGQIEAIRSELLAAHPALFSEAGQNLQSTGAVNVP